MNQEVHAVHFGAWAKEQPEIPAPQFSCQFETLNVRVPVDLERMAPSARRIAQANLSIVLQSMSELSQKVVADRIGVADGTLSTMKTEHLGRFCALLAACNLKAVPVTDRTVSEAESRARNTLLLALLSREQEGANEGADE